MVKRWNEEIVKIDGVDFIVIEDFISIITCIPILEKKFYKDRKIWGQAELEFTKDQEGKKRLVKRGTHYLLSSIKLL